MIFAGGGNQRKLGEELPQGSRNVGGVWQPSWSTVSYTVLSLPIFDRINEMVFKGTSYEDCRAKLKCYEAELEARTCSWVAPPYRSHHIVHNLPNELGTNKVCNLPKELDLHNVLDVQHTTVLVTRWFKSLWAMPRSLSPVTYVVRTPADISHAWFLRLACVRPSCREEESIREVEGQSQGSQ